jgi:hypothetical protein
MLAQRQPAVPRLPHAGRVEQTVESVGEETEYGQLRHVLQHGPELLALACAKVFPTGHDEIAVFEDKVRFVLAGERAAAALAFAGTAASAAPPASALTGELTPQAFDTVQELLVNVLEDVENA